MYEEDFVKEDLVEFEIDKKKFKYKPTTAGEENDWLNEYMIEGEDGKPKQDYSKLNKCKVDNIKSVPYDKETINKIIEVNKEWKDLNKDQKWKLLGKLKPGMFDKIIRKINEIDRPDDSKKKD